MQTWVEGIPVKGKSARPAKPSRAAALQILQQLASQHCQSECPSEKSADAAVPGNTAAACCTQDAAAAVNLSNLDSQTEFDIAGDSQLVQPQQLPALKMAHGEIESESEAEVSGGVESDSEAGLNLRGRVASDEEDDRQGPEALAGLVIASADGQADPAPPGEYSHAEESEADLSSAPAVALDSVPTRTLIGIADKQPHLVSLSKLIRQQRRRMLRSQRQASSQSDTLLALTEAQQHQWQPEDSLTSTTSEIPSKAAVFECSSISAQTHTPVLGAQLASGQGRLHAQRNEHYAGQLVSGVVEEEEDGPGSSSKANGQDEHPLWQNLAEALQDKQRCQKLAHLTVTLLSRM